MGIGFIIGRLLILAAIAFLGDFGIVAVVSLVIKKRSTSIMVASIIAWAWAPLALIGSALVNPDRSGDLAAFLLAIVAALANIPITTAAVIGWNLVNPPKEFLE
jgi:hypothetical protein